MASAKRLRAAWRNWRRRVSTRRERVTTEVECGADELPEPAVSEPWCPECGNVVRLQDAAMKELEAEVEGLRNSIDAWEMDPHNYSKRPCGTCQQMTKALGKPFGCVRYALTDMPYVRRETAEAEPVQGATQ